MSKILNQFFIPDIYDIIQSYIMISKLQVRYKMFFVIMQYTLLITRFDIPSLTF